MSAAEWVGWVVIAAITITTVATVLSILVDIFSGDRKRRRELVAERDLLRLEVVRLEREAAYYQQMLEAELRKSV